MIKELMKYMNMKRYWFVTLWGILLGAVSCSDLPELSVSSPDITIEYPEDIDVSKIYNDSLSFQDISSGNSWKIKATEVNEIPNGFYRISYNANVTLSREGTEIEGALRGTLENVIIDESHGSFNMKTYLTIDKDDFIFEEIFFTGTLRESGKQYYGDSYVKLYNNTDHVLYADGVAFVESKFVSTLNYLYKPDIQKDTMTVQAIYVVPGSGKDHPVQPGESFVLCDTGIDHRTANPNSFDLSHVDFEWYDVSTKPSHMDIDSETVPNLDKWYCYTLSFFVLHNRGFRSYAIARIPVDKETYLKDYFYTYEYIIPTPVGNFPMQQTAYKLPNDWILDGVNCSVEAEWQWNILPVTVDGGWTHCGTIDRDKTRYFKSVRRKMIGLDKYGHRILKDTNNSTDDFNTECVPSLIEEQHSAIAADGTKAEKITYDGVQEIKE